MTVSIPSGHATNIFGPFDRHLKKIESAFDISLIARDGSTRIVGTEKGINQANHLLTQLIALSEKGVTIDDQKIDYAISLAKDAADQVPNESAEPPSAPLVEMDRQVIAHTATGKPIKPKTLGQQAYVRNIRDKMIVFGIGPAGTGKTYLAMAMAIQAFKENQVERIILTRPAIEAGEKLGFLPGDLQSKVDPYLRPLYDALNQIMGAETYHNNAEKGLIEVAPLAYMRGRTLDNAFIILDEAQNTTPAQMKMFLTRIGFGSKVVITGDLTQKDLPGDTMSGLDEALKVLKGIDDIGFSELTSRDVVRHPLVQKIVMAYDAYDKKEAAAAARRKDRAAYLREERRDQKRNQRK